MRTKTLDLDFPTLDKLQSEKAPATRTIKKIDPVVRTVPKIRVASYARISTAHDDQKESIVIQRQHFNSLAKRQHDWIYVGCYWDVMSGTKKDKRPGLQRLLADCRAGRVNLILTKSISRLARNVTDLLEMVREMTATGVRIIFDRENIDTGTMDSELLLTILATMANEESKSFAANNRWAIQKRFKDGTYRRGVAPYGFDLVDGSLAVNEEEAETIRYIFSRMLCGIGCSTIAKELNERQIPTKRVGEKRKDGVIHSGKWKAATIRGMIRNEVYMGDSRLQKTFKDTLFKTHLNEGQLPQYYYEDNHPAIISREAFARANRVLDQHFKECGAVKAAAPGYTFTKKLVCGYCGALLWRCSDTRKANKRRYWLCSTHHKDGAKACSMKRVMEENVENAFTTMMNKLHFCDLVVVAFRDMMWKGWRDRCGDELRSLEAGLAQNSINQLNLQAQRGTMDQAMFHTQMDILKAQEVETRAEIDLIMDSQVTEADKLLSLVQAWGIKTKFKAETFEALIEKVVVRDRETFEFQFKCGLRLTETVIYELPEAPIISTPPAPSEQEQLLLPEGETDAGPRRNVIKILPVRKVTEGL